MIMIIETLRYRRYRRHYFICLTFMIYFIALGAVTWIAGKYGLTVMCMISVLVAAYVLFYHLLQVAGEIGWKAGRQGARLPGNRDANYGQLNNEIADDEFANGWLRLPRGLRN